MLWNAFSMTDFDSQERSWISGVDAIGIMTNCPVPLCIIGSYPRRQDLRLVMLQNVIMPYLNDPTLLWHIILYFGETSFSCHFLSDCGFFSFLGYEVNG
jgi:hypothetical protein